MTQKIRSEELKKKQNTSGSVFLSLQAKCLTCGNLDQIKYQRLDPLIIQTTTAGNL